MKRIRLKSEKTRQFYEMKRENEQQTHFLKPQLLFIIVSKQ